MVELSRLGQEGTSVITRLSQLFVRTLHEDLADAEVASHRWLARAGYIRRVTSGMYSWLPLGLKVMQKVEGILCEEMEAAGGQEVRFPALLPRDPYETTSRWTEYKESLFRLQDRHGSDMLLGPTHKEMLTLLVDDLYSSYKDLPLMFFQIQTKYRDEARPRAGLFRGRKFVMKDAYSFDVDDVDLEASYQTIRDVYIRIFDRLGLEYVIVKATSGAMGGSAPEEFQAVLSAGEDSSVHSPGGYAADVGTVTATFPSAVDFDDVPDAVVVDTPGTPTILSLMGLLDTSHPCGDREWDAADTLKNVVPKVTEPDGSIWPLATGLPGDREVDVRRLAVALAPVEVAPFEETDFAAHPSLVRGYIGPSALGEKPPSKVRYLVNPRVVIGTEWVTGTDQQDRHVMHPVVGRGFTPDGVIDVAEVCEGDPVSDGSGPFDLERGMEVGHIFQLGRKYAEALDLKVLDRSGKLVTAAMGSYGIGISRIVAAVAETTCDDKGLAWPVELAPYQVQVMVTGKGQEMFQAVEDLTGKLSDLGLDILYDDRKASPGVKFTSAKLLGMPVAVVIGRDLANGVVEIRSRHTGEKRKVSVADAVAAVREFAGD